MLPGILDVDWSKYIVISWLTLLPIISVFSHCIVRIRTKSCARIYNQSVADPSLHLGGGGAGGLELDELESVASEQPPLMRTL